jgi:hypothetical protein
VIIGDKNTSDCVWRFVIRCHCPFFHLSIHLPQPVHLTVRMSGERTELEKSVEEVIKKFMANKAMSEGVQASSTRVLQASPSTGRRSILVNPTTEQQSKHRGDMANAKYILPYYNPTLGWRG